MATHSFSVRPSTRVISSWNFWFTRQPHQSKKRGNSSGTVTEITSKDSRRIKSNKRGFVINMIRTLCVTVLAVLLSACGGGSSSNCYGLEYCTSLASANYSSSSNGLGYNFSGNMAVQFSPTMPSGQSIQGVIYTGDGPTSISVTGTSTTTVPIPLSVGGSALSCNCLPSPTGILFYLNGGTTVVACADVSWQTSCSCATPFPGCSSFQQQASRQQGLWSSRLDRR